MNAVRVVVRGRVQGVGFRAWVVRAASELGVAGEVWNRRDGGVEAEGVGPPDTLRRFVAALRRGPTHARVEQLVEEWFEREPPKGGFRIRDGAERA
jgi:acylphosphatase